MCDLNRPPLPRFPAATVVVFSSVLEYFHDVPSVITHLRPTCTMILASYTIAQRKNPTALLRRRSSGWTNDYSEAEFVDAFAERGFACTRQLSWNDQRIF